MKTFIIAIMATAMVLAAGELAEAKKWPDDGRHAAHSKTSSGKPKSDFIVMKCKTKACFKKHPGGTYAFTPKAKRAH